MKERYNFRVNGLEIEAEFSGKDRENIFIPLLRKLTALQKEKQRRIAVFFGAPPAAGKSTLCCYLELLSREVPGLTPVQCMGIDGFHHYQEYLDTHFIEKDGAAIPLAKIKGAPETYDVPKLAALLDKLNEPGQKWPVYDRRIHNPVEQAVEITEDILIVEGNWLLLNEAPWNKLQCDYSIFLAAGDPSQLERIVQRKMMGGFSEEHAREIVQKNDWPNILRCMRSSRRGDMNLRSGKNGNWEEF
ncbi:MAG: nucleoside/nucleotide kinase family protein [Clostridia bacterium]|nr:nucleoside/nucleotide kinase family protein [Clostridia bacterium]